MDGEETVWMIKLAGSQKNVPLDPDAAEYFTDVNLLRETLINRTTAQVNTMLDKTIEIANETFGARVQQSFESISIPASINEQAPNITVVLPDGTKAKVRV